jgi:hypothetical protein
MKSTSTMSMNKKMPVILLGLLCALLWAAPSWAFTIAFSDAGSTTVWSASTTGTVAVSAAAGDRICVGSDVRVSTRTITITDNRSGASHTYTRVANREISGNLEVWLDCVVADSPVTQITGTISSTIATESHLYAWVIGGGSASLGTPNAVTAETNPAGVSHNPGTITIAGSSALLLGASVHNGTSTFTLDGDYTSRYSQTGIIVGDDEVTANADMANTTGGNRVSISYLYEVPPLETASPRNLMLMGVGQ